jgi:purine nucleosidase/pyrimidine-specific ribonucleoside hydrolase
MTPAAAATPTLIDTDPGIDDALALLFAWSSPELRVDTITTVAGNVGVAAGTTNVLRLIGLRRPSPRPVVAAGAEGPLARPLVTATHYHGEDGLGDLKDWPPTGQSPAGAVAPDLILGAARRFERELTLIALGPLTNLALALRADAERLARIGRLVVMGGAVDVPGNVTPTAEFNFHVDPEAAHRVLAAGLPLDLVPLDATRQTVLPRPWLKTTLARTPGSLATRIHTMTDRTFRLDHAIGAHGMVLHDPLAVAVAVDSTLVEWEAARLMIGPDGETERAAGKANCRVARAVDVDRFLRLFLDRLCPASS